MTTARYLAYKRVLASLDELPPGLIGDSEREVLGDCAEGLLLTRDGREEREELLDRASLVLSMLFGAQRITAAQSELLWAGLVACGPSQVDLLVPRRPSYTAAA